MTPADGTRDGTRESRLDDLRRQAAETGRVDGTGIVPSGAPFPVAAPRNGYYGLPLLKKPVWTWEVPAYFFVGGAAGAAAVIAEAARLRGDVGLEREARWVTAAGAVLSAPLLIADLGRPERFLYMLRVFKPQSPMSVGVWIVVAFSNAAAAALAAHEVERRFGRSRSARLVERTSGPAAALTGLGMATYTGVLIGATAVPIWSRNARLLPWHFAFSALGAASSLLQLRRPRHPALRRMGLIAAAVETGIAAHLELSRDRAHEPARRGTSGWLMRAAGLLSGPIPLALRLLGRRSPAAARAAAVATIAGSLLTRYAWLAAGRSSAADPREPLQLPTDARRTAPRELVPAPASQRQAPIAIASIQADGRPRDAAARRQPATFEGTGSE